MVRECVHRWCGGVDMVGLCGHECWRSVVIHTSVTLNPAY